MTPRPRSLVARLAVLPALALVTPLHAQDQELSFSVDWQGGRKGTLDQAGVPITEGDVLSPQGGLPGFSLGPPDVRFTGGFLGLTRYALCVGTPPGNPCGIELDALSYGLDMPLPSDPKVAYTILFSVDEWSQGLSALPRPSIFSEAQAGDISADLLVSPGLPPIPVPPGFPPRHVAVVDGDGEVSASGSLYPGLGLLEPNLPGGGVPDLGDNLDAIDVGPVPDPTKGSIYFSLDGDRQDPFEGVAGSGSAQFQGAFPGDVLRRLPTGQLVLYAPAASLGLDRVAPGVDDLDLLILWENGVDGFQPPDEVFDWETGPDPMDGTDMLLFSVRRGSAVIGALDSLQGLKIVEGDILMPPVAGGNGNPAIVIPAEALGMSVNRDAGQSDDANGGDALPDPYQDCNGNEVEDAVDIANGSSKDDNGNGIPDECEPGIRYCFCDPAVAPCGNPDDNAGCANSTGFGAALHGAGTTSVTTDDLVLAAVGMPAGQFGLVFMGGAPASVPLADGVRCVGGGAVGLYRFPPKPTGANGSFLYGPGLVAASQNFALGGHIDTGETWFFQAWYRDGMTGPCGSKSNLSNGLKVTFLP